MSQAVFEGVSYTATDRNYFYPDPVHDSDWWFYKFSTIANGSVPWIQVGEFYEFLTANYYNLINWGIALRGPAGTPVSLCNINMGDLIFMYLNGQGWWHSVIVDQLGSNPCKANNVFVAAHNDDAHLRPLSDYSGFLWYPVEVKGYFDELHLAFLPIAYSSSQSFYESPIENTSEQPFPSQNPYPTP